MSKDIRRSKRRRKATINLKTILIIAISLIAILLIILLIRNALVKKEKNNEELLEQEINLLFEEINSESEEFMKPEDTTINIVAVGGVFCQEEIYKSAYNEETKEYNFYNNFHKIVNRISNADIAIALLETNFIDEPYYAKIKHNAPKKLAETLKLIGIDIINTATNYCFDYGIEGIDSTKSILEENKIDVIGTYRTEEEANTILIEEIEDIRIAFLSYTYGTNNAISKGYEYAVNITNKEKIKQDIKKAKADNADFIFVNMHWGDLNSQTPNEEQQDLANYLVENGANVIIGTHPAQIQPMEMRKISENKDVLVAYSTGNFLSIEEYENSNLGLMINIQITKSAETNEKYLSKIVYTPIYTYENSEAIANKYQILDIREEIKRYEDNQEGKVSKELYDELKNEIVKVEELIGGNQ